MQDSTDATQLTKKSAFTKLDTFLKHYVSFTSSAANQDKGLKLLQWTLWLFSRIYKKKSQGLRKVYLDLSFARYILRFYGLPESIHAYRTGGYAASDKRQWLGSLMSLSMMAYYPFEHWAYLKWTSPKLFATHRRTANRLSAVSCSFWLVYLVADLGQSAMALKDMYSERKKLAEDAGENSDKQQLQELDESIQNMQLGMTRTALFTLPCVNWALPNWDTQPLLSENVCNGLMWLESVVSMAQAVRNYQLSARKDDNEMESSSSE